MLLILLPNQGAFPQSMSPAATPAAADQAQAAPTPDQAPAAPAAPAEPASPTAPPADQSPSVPAAGDQGAAPAAPADTNAPTALGPNGKPKKLITSPDTSPPPGGGEGPIVREINVEYIGPHTVAKSVILSNMRTSVGEIYSAASVEEDVRNLYATGFFTNLKIDDEPLGDGVRVNVVVEPKPLVKEVDIKGNQKVKTARLRKEIKTKPGETLSEQQISTDADKIKDYYLSKGYNQVQVTYKVDTNEEFGRSVVTFIVSEGDRAYVTEVDFVGNQQLTTKELAQDPEDAQEELAVVHQQVGACSRRTISSRTWSTCAPIIIARATSTWRSRTSSTTIRPLTR